MSMNSNQQLVKSDVDSDKPMVQLHESKNEEAESLLSDEHSSVIEKPTIAEETPSRWKRQIDVLKDSTTKKRKVGDKNLLYCEETKIASDSIGKYVYVGLLDGEYPVAIKKLLSENARKEANAQNSCENKLLQHVLPDDDVVEDDDFTYNVSPLCEWNLEQAMKESFPLKEKLGLHQWRVNVCEQILKGIKELHDHDILHRNLKPENVLIDRDGNVKISDFGFSRQILWKTTTVEESTAKKRWMPNEVLARPGNDYKYQKSADIHVAGCLLYYVLTGGNHPYEGKYIYPGCNSVTKNIQEDNVSLNHLKDNPEYVSLLTKMIHRNPARRPDIAECLFLFQTKCCKCQKFGHFSWDCPIFQTCTSCKQQGHISVGCPGYSVWR